MEVENEMEIFIASTKYNTRQQREEGKPLLEVVSKLPPRGCPCGVMIKVLDCGIVVSEFELQLHYYVHFRTNTLGKGMNPLILLAMG